LKYSIIIPSFNTLSALIDCVHSVYKHSLNFEIIIVDDGSSDGSIEWLKNLAYHQTNSNVLLHDKNMGFSQSVNTGLSVAKGDYIVILNSDTVVTPGWLDSMREVFTSGKKKFKVKKIGAVGPVSNYAGGIQGIQTDNYTMDVLDKSAIDHREANKDSMALTGFLSGFCMMISAECLAEVNPFDVQFKQGFWEDNDFSLRCQLAGWSLVVDQSTFIHHIGSVTFKSMGIDTSSLMLSNQLKFYAKHSTPRHQKLLVISRIRDGEDYLVDFLSSVSIFADGVIVLLDRCTDKSDRICKTFDKVIEIIYQDAGFNEKRDRLLLQKAAQAHGADWIMSLDCDEIMEENFTYDYVHDLLNPIDPQILAYSFPFKTFYLGKTHFRSDGVFGKMRSTRLWRNIVGFFPFGSGSLGLHCTHGPLVPSFNVRDLRTRIKHYGYDSDEKTLAKFRHYTTLDPKPDLIKTSNRGYEHLCANNLSLYRYTRTNTVTLCMLVKNEEKNLFSTLSRLYPYFDDIVIIDTGSSVKTLEVAKLFHARVFDYHFKDDFSAARNFANSKCTTNWIFTLDADEMIRTEDISTMFMMLDEDCDAWLFQFENYQKDGSIVYSDNVRLCRNIPGLRWSWRVHENMAPSIEKNNLKVLTSPFMLQHFGFLKPPTSGESKLISYGRMLSKQIAENPKSALAYFHKAFHEFEVNHYEKGMELLKKATVLEKHFFLAHKELGLRYLNQAAAAMDAAVDSTPEAHYYRKYITETTAAIHRILSNTME